MHPIYSDDLSADEAALGFKRVYVRNPDRHYFAAGSIVSAVILPIPHALRIIKLNTPTGESSYPIQGFGVLPMTDPEDADWCTIISGAPDPRSAISMAAHGPEVPLDLATPVIDLRCPKCSHEFQLEVEYLPTDGATTCPKCSHSEDTKEFNALNV